MLDYIADFMCKELLLVIEVDGLSHHWDETIEKDKRKDDALQKAGFTVIRFHDDEVLKSMDAVIKTIECKIEEIEKAKSASGL